MSKSLCTLHIFCYFCTKTNRYIKFMPAIFSKIRKEDSENTRQWDLLVTRLIAGDVIPVIGPEFLVNDEKGSNPHQILIDDLAEAYEISSHPKSFSELLYDKDFDASDRKNIYAMLGDAFSQPLFEPSTLLRRLLATKRFPFVITTSFTPVVEDAMREIWGTDQLRVMKFTNDPSHNDDISTRSDINKPTIYYMFGKVCRSEKKYVVTDYDMLSFCRSWLSSAERPQNLASELVRRAVAEIEARGGSGIPLWYFSLKGKIDNQPMGMVVDPIAEDSFLQFMKRIDTFTQRNAEEVINKMETMLQERETELQKTRFNTPQQGTDVFISYSRADAEVTARLYEALTARGINVWYDRNSISMGGNFMNEIIAGIKSTKLFVPIMTRNIQAQHNEYHPYRTEWKTAIDLATGYGRTFIMPASEKDFDFYGADIPDALKACNAYLYDADNPDFEPFIDQIQKLLANI